MGLSVSSEKQQESPVQKLERAAISRWKLETLTGLLGIRSLRAHQKESERNMAAENRAVREKLWGESGHTGTGDDVGPTILGDNIVHQPPVIVTGQQSSGLGQLVGAALLGASLLGIPGAGVAAYLYGKSQQPAAQNTTIEKIEDVGLGLLRLEDLKTPTPEAGQ